MWRRGDIALRDDDGRALAREHLRTAGPYSTVREMNRKQATAQAAAVMVEDVAGGAPRRHRVASAKAAERRALASGLLGAVEAAGYCVERKEQPT